MTRRSLGVTTLQQAGPVNYVTADDPPFLILQGDQDLLVPLDQSKELRRRLQAAGVSAQLVIVTRMPDIC